MDKSTCYFHDDKQANAQCKVCGRKLCEKCMLQEKNNKKIICPNCFNNPTAKKQAQDIYWLPILILLVIVVFIIRFLAKSF